MISEAAVEAAARHLAAKDGDLLGWLIYQSEAQDILNAAAPHLAEHTPPDGAVEA